MKSFLEQPHTRKNILTGEYVLVSPQRTLRPWQGSSEDVNVNEKKQEYDANCYLCPGNKRISGVVNPFYDGCFSFINDFSAINECSNDFEIDEELFKAKVEKGICKVICYSPNHSKTMADLSLNEIKRVVKLWIHEFKEMSRIEYVNYIQIFENKGQLMGCSNPHPHGQIWSQSSIPQEIKKKSEHQFLYFKKNKSSLLCDYWMEEKKRGERVVFENNFFVLLVPFWAVWPYETMIIPKRMSSTIDLMIEEEIEAFAEILGRLTNLYDKIFNCSFPYSCGIHQAPTDLGDYSYWHWHMSFYPPLLRSSTIKKFMVGYEMFGMAQRDLTPEFSAKLMRDLL